jgi:hypothetical protein
MPLGAISDCQEVARRTKQPFMGIKAVPGTLAFLISFLSIGCGNGDTAGNASLVVMDSSITSNQCVLSVRIDQPASIDSAAIVLDYTGIDGSFGDRGNARCRNLADGATSTQALNRCDATCEKGEHRDIYLSFTIGELSDGLLLDTPADIAECLFEGDAESLQELSAEVHLWNATGDLVQDRPVALHVRCDGWPATTTTSSTTTTLPCDEDGCQAGDIIPVEFFLDDAVELGSLQFEVRFGSDVGAFDQYETASIRCALPAGANALYATNQYPRADDPACSNCQRQLNVGFVFQSPYTGPGRLLTCEFVIGSRAPGTEDFEITLVESSNPQVEPVRPFPSVSVRLPDL